MARARNIKPSLFKNEVLGVADPMLTILFASLWCLADREGRLEDRPLRIKAETFPYRENININGYLTELERLEFIHRYIYNGTAIIQVINFHKHQNPHKTEKDSTLQEYSEESCGCPLTVKDTLNNGSRPADSGFLIPDSLNTDSLIPDSGLPDSLNVAEGKKQKKPLAVASDKPPPKKESITVETWKAYSNAYQDRYQVTPVRNATVNGQLSSFVKRIGAEESPHVAAFFVTHNNQFYVTKMHTVGLLLADAEKLRTEWATNKTVTHSQARQVDKTQKNY